MRIILVIYVLEFSECSSDIYKLPFKRWRSIIIKIIWFPIKFKSLGKGDGGFEEK